jgi:beta-lactamase class A
MNWLVGDKTGANGVGMSADIGFAWPPARGPLVIAAYCDMPHVAPDTRDWIIAQVGRIAAAL